MSEEKRKLIIDTDCGSDDAVAIAMAINDDRYEVLMISTVSGNVRVDQATANTLTTLKMVQNYHPPVYRGENDMLKREWEGSDTTHGHDGMGDLGLIDYRLECQGDHAVSKILETLRKYDDGQIDIITLGPLTNIARACERDCETMKKARRIVMMATPGTAEGNITDHAEFNVWQDGEAFDAVLKAGLKQLVLVGWSACLDEAMLNERQIDMIRESGRLGAFLIDCNSSLMALNIIRFHEKCLDMADPAAVAAALYPECIAKSEDCYVEIDLNEGEHFGEVSFDHDRKPNVRLVTRLHADLFKEYLISKVKEH